MCSLSKDPDCSKCQLWHHMLMGFAQVLLERSLLMKDSSFSQVEISSNHTGVKHTHTISMMLHSHYQATKHRSFSQQHTAFEFLDFPTSQTIASDVSSDLSYSACASTFRLSQLLQFTPVYCLTHKQNNHGFVLFYHKQSFTKCDDKASRSSV